MLEVFRRMWFYWWNEYDCSFMAVFLGFHNKIGQGKATRFWKKRRKKEHPKKLRMFLHEKTMLPIYRKNHIVSFVSRSPDLRSSLQNPFPDWHCQSSGIMFCNSLSQWRDRTGIQPVSLLIHVKIFTGTYKGWFKTNKCYLICVTSISYIPIFVQKFFIWNCIFLYTIFFMLYSELLFFYAVYRAFYVKYTCCFSLIHDIIPL